MSIPFMNAIQSQVSGTGQGAQQPLVLNEGQMIHGKIDQLFPGQLAEVQVGSHKMVAKLEVPMRAGDSYYFQVTSVQPEVQLKIISGPTSAQAGGQQQLQNLMQAMQLPKSPEMTRLLSFVLDNKIPISREGILQAVQLLQATPVENQQQALTSIQKMLDLKLPLTNNLFQAILGVESKESLHPTMQSLKVALQNDTSMPTQMRDNILQLLSQVERPLAASTGQALLGESLKTLLNTNESPESRFSTLQLLKESGIIPRQASLPNLQSTLATAVANRLGIPPQVNPVNQGLQATQQAPQGNLTPVQLENIRQFVSELTSLTANQKEGLMATARSQGMQPFANALLQTLSSNLTSHSAPLTNQSRQTLLSLLSAEEPTQQTPNKVAALLQNAERSTQTMVQQLVQTAESTVATAMDGKIMKDAMQTIFRSLGMNYESALLGKDAQSERFMDMLKPQLLTMLNDPSVSSNVREAAEQFVVRMNGSPLASTESGVNHQLVMQLPLEFFGKKIDATLQWSGRMKDDGKIDADFARVLFYLNLHSLEETVVDMQVQNRVVTVTIFNEEPSLRVIGQPLQEKLKDGLSVIGYTLSGVFFKGFVEQEQTHKPTPAKEVVEGGVDFRI